MIVEKNIVWRGKAGYNLNNLKFLTELKYINAKMVP